MNLITMPFESVVLYGGAFWVEENWDSNIGQTFHRFGYVEATELSRAVSIKFLL